MINNAADPVWEKLIRGDLNVTVSQISAQMLLNRCRRNLDKDPSPTNINKLKSEVHTFFCKFESILQDEIKQLFG